MKLPFMARLKSFIDRKTHSHVEPTSGSKQKPKLRQSNIVASGDVAGRNIIKSNTMGSISINGKTYQGNSITIIDGNVTIDGVPQFPVEATAGVYRIEIIGDVGSVTTDAPLTIKGNVSGGVRADGPVTCGPVYGDVNVHGPLACGDVTGDVVADGPVTCIYDT